MESLNRQLRRDSENVKKKYWLFSFAFIFVVIAFALYEYGVHNREIQVLTEENVRCTEEIQRISNQNNQLENDKKICLTSLSELEEKIQSLQGVIQINEIEKMNWMHKLEMEQERSNSLTSQVSSKEEEIKFRLKKYEFLEQEILTKWIRRKEVEGETPSDKNIVYEKCVAGCEVLNSVANFVFCSVTPCGIN